jgi:hypothetical protein
MPRSIRHELSSLTRRRSIAFATGISGIFMLLSLAISMSGCSFYRAGGLSRITSIRAMDCVFWEPLSIPLSFSRGYQAHDTATFFLSDDNALDLQVEIASLPASDSITLQLIDSDNLLITKNLSGNRKAQYLLRKDHRADGFYFFGMGASFSGSNFLLAFPYFYTDDSRWDGFYSGFELGEKYSTQHDADDFFDFYTTLGAYSIERTQSGFKINGYSQDIPTPSDLPKFPWSFDFSFTERAGQTYFIIEAES